MLCDGCKGDGSCGVGLLPLGVFLPAAVIRDAGLDWHGQRPRLTGRLFMATAPPLFTALLLGRGQKLMRAQSCG